MVSMFSEMFPPKSQFDASMVPDLTGKVIVVTGGYAGIGFSIAKATACKNGKVYVAGRSEAKGLQALREIQALTPTADVHFLKLDLADLDSVREAARQLQALEKQVDILFNNAAAMNPPLGDLTAQGLDYQFGVAVLGHFLFTKLLLPQLKRPSGEHSRIVFTSSGLHLFGKIHFESFRDGSVRRKLGTRQMYNQSKLGVVILANEIARRYESDGIVSMSLNPGNISSQLQRHQGKIEGVLTRMLFLHDPSFGPLTALWGGTSPEGAQFNGKYLVPWARLGACAPSGRDADLGAKLWDALEGLSESR